MTKRVIGGALFAGALLVSAQVEASAVEDRWLPYQGCWQAEDAPAGALLCVVPDGAGVRLVEIADGKVLRDSRIVADGSPQAISREGCSGNETSRWSSDGQRIYLETTMTCGEQLQRKTSGLFALLSQSEWLSIQAIEVGKEAAIRSVRYRAVEAPTGVPAEITNVLKANRLARETARAAASQDLALQDVAEAAHAVHGRAVETLLMARNQPFDLDGRKLIQLADAGVPDYLIDAVVAVSNPDVFEVRPSKAMVAVEDAPRAGRSGDSARCDRYSWYDPWCDGSNYGYSRYSPFGGGYYSPYSYGYGYYQPPVIVIRDPGNEPGRTRGRVTRDGYRSGESSSSGETRSSVGSSTKDSSASGASTTGSSSSGSSSTSSEPRKAKPRGSGGN